MREKTTLKIVFLLVACLSVHFSWAQNCNCKYTVKLSEVNVDGKALGIKPGDVICLQAGTRSVLRFSNIIGTADKPVIIKNCGGVANVENGDRNYSIWVSTSRYFKISGTGDASKQYGIRCKTTKSGSNALVVSDLSSDVEIENVEIAGAGFSGIMAKTDPRCDLSANRGRFTMYNVVVHDNYVHDVGGEGMYIGNSFFNGWNGNTLCLGTLLFPHDVVGCKVYKNIVKRTGAEAIQVGAATSGCEIYSNDIELYGQDPFANYQDNGIQIGLGTGGLLYNNKIRKGPGNGILVQGKGDNKIYNNIIIDAGSSGIYCDDATTVGTLGPGFSFVNNTIINPGDDGLKIAAERVSMNHFINNIVIKPGSGKYVNKVHPTVKLQELNNFYSNNIADAKFVNASAYDYHLLTASPAMNKGTSTSSYGVTFDFDKKSRPAGGVYDIGAFELQAGGNSAPTVNAGADKTITTSSITITGTASDADGSIASYAWTKQSGPSATLSGANTAKLTASALVAGSYTFRLTVKDNAGASAYDDVVITVTSSSSKPPVSAATPIYRISNGGTTIGASPINWSADKQSGKSKYLDNKSANYTAGGSSWTGTNTTGAPNNLFGPNRYSPDYGGTVMQWNFPVQSGTYQVNLYFAESPYTGGVKKAGARVFHVNAEGTRKLSNIDIYAQAGMNALKKQFEVTVTDGTLDLDFVRQVGNPQVNGIEIISLTTQASTTTARTASDSESAMNATEADTTAVDGRDRSLGVSISPNPFNDKLNLTLESTSENVSIELQDMSGYTVLHELQQGVSQVTLDFSSRQIPTGIYIITVNVDGRISKQRLIKK